MGVNSYISIGNSDDRLTQQDWADFIREVRALLTVEWRGRLQVHGEWFAGPDQPWQNANWCVEILPPSWWRKAAQDGPAKATLARDQEMWEQRGQLKKDVKAICLRYRQDSFAWTTGTVELVQTNWLAQEMARQHATNRTMILAPDGTLHIGQTLDQRHTAQEWEGVKSLDQAVREGWLPTPGEESASNQQEPASTGDGEEPEHWAGRGHCHVPGAVCQIDGCGWEKPVTVGVDAAQARMNALRERHGYRKERQRARHEEMHPAVRYEDCPHPDCTLFWGQI